MAAETVTHGHLRTAHAQHHVRAQMSPADEGSLALQVQPDCMTMNALKCSMYCIALRVMVGESQVILLQYGPDKHIAKLTGFYLIDL